MTPHEGRRLWAEILDGAGRGEPLDSQVLHHLIEGFMIDIIDKRIEQSNTLAVTAGKRITTLVAAITEARNV